RAGARGYLVKDMPIESVIACVREVHAGRTCIPPAIASKLAERVSTIDLTARERQVLGQVAKGKGNREIGTDLSVTEGTVKVGVCRGEAPRPSTGHERTPADHGHDRRTRPDPARRGPPAGDGRTLLAGADPRTRRGPPPPRRPDPPGTSRGSPEPEGAVEDGR